MSLLRRLWLSVLIAMLAILLGTWAVSVATARLYLQQQLLAQGADAAVSLALSMSQRGRDPAMAEVLVSALFDSGHFESVRYQDVGGRAVVERVRGAAPGEVAVPDWFVRLAPLAARPGTALVSDGWQQAGSVTVVADPRYAHAALWRGTLQLGGLLAVAGVLWAIGMTAVVRWLRRPLVDMAEQAEAIGQGRFVTVRVPKVLELRSVAHALNRMAGRVQAMFAEQATRIGRLHEEATRDPLTGLPNRGYFMGVLRSALQDESDAEAGALLVLRVADLPALNRHLGRERTDAWLAAVAGVLRQAVPAGADATLARLNGADFGCLLPGADADAALALARTARAAVLTLQAWPRQDGDADTPPLRAVCDIAVGSWRRGEELGAVLARTDGALMQAETAVDGLARAADAPPASDPAPAGEAAWGALLDRAIAERRFQLAYYPVCRTDGSLLHREAMLRMVPGADAAPGAALLSAGQFMPAALRLGRVADCDLVAVDLAMAQLQAAPQAIAINLSPRSLLDAHFLAGLEARLAAAPALCPWLSFELSERGLDERIDALATLAHLLARHGCKLGIEHFGRQLATLPRLYELPVHYLKVDGAFVAGIEQHDGHQRLLRAVVEVARGLEVEVYAEQVSSQAEWDALAALGVRAVTGPAVTRRMQAG